jgi:hypothetical protein
LAVSAVVSSTGNDWGRRGAALIRQVQSADRWFVPQQAGLDSLPIPPRIRRKIPQRNVISGKRRRKGKLPAKYQRWIERTWERPAVSFRDVLAAQVPPRGSAPHDGLSPNDHTLAALQQLAYGASHEINNPLANISARAQLLMRRCEEPALLRHLAAIHQQALRAHEMIADLTFFAKPPQLQYTIVDLANLVRVAVAQARQEAANAQQIEVRERLDASLIQADAVLLTVAIKAVVRNAIEALQGQGAIWIDLKCRTPRHRPPRLKLRIRDNGPGLSPEARRHLFDPFFSGRESGRGLGFGLTKTWTILRLHQGRISVRAPRGGGVEFVLRLPCDAIGSGKLGSDTAWPGTPGAGVSGE